jgi:lysophospholipase L1-like esterase
LNCLSFTAKRACVAQWKFRFSLCTHMTSISKAAGLASLLLIATCTGALAEERASAADICLAANRGISVGVPLPRTAARLKAGDTLRVVAVGSSSTSGLGVFSGSATYPEMMRRELMALKAGARVESINSGRIGERIPGTVARFERDVLAYRPDLVVWQLGTNDVVWSREVNGLKDLMVSGVHTLKASKADVILMDLQYVPMVLASPQTATMQAMIGEVAREQRVGLFSRFALMRRAVEAGLAPNALVSWDRLHNSAAGYECIGRALARAIHASGPAFAEGPAAKRTSRP